MADGDSKHPLPPSPTEDYNPLADDLKQQGHDADCSESGEDDVDSQCNSVDDQFAPLLYSITPPASARGMKLEKKKQQSYVQKSTYKQYVETRKFKKGHSKGPINVIKERYADDPVFCKLSGVDSDDNLERHFGTGDDKEKKNLDNRESKKKIMKNSRAHERLAKRSSSDLAAIDTNTAEVPLPLNSSVKVDTSGKFTSFSLKSSPLTLSGSFSASFGSRSIDLRRQSVWNVEIPKERLDFYKIFSTLINMGSQNKKEKEGKSAKDRLMNSYRRQVSSEQEMWAERWKEYLWMELQMEQNGFTSFQMQEDYLKCQREKIPEVLNEIMNFKLDYSVDLDRRESANCDCDNVDKLDICENTSNSALNAVDLCCSIELTQETLNRQRDALIRVGQLLEKLDACEQLFPTSNAFAKEFSKYGEEEFVQQVKSLYLWQNITRDLYHKVKLLSKILGIPNMLGVDLDLPGDFEQRSTPSAHSVHRQSIPEIQEPTESILCPDSTDDELEDCVQCTGSTPTSDDIKQSPNGNSKRVTFTIDSNRSSRDTSPVSMPLEASTPVRPQSRPLSGSNLSRASSEASLDDFDKTSVYRKYVDKTLKRMGMNKMLLRFKDILERTLQRAREALQQLKTTSGNDSKSSDFESAVQMSSSPALDLNIPEFGSGVPSFHRSSSLTDCGAWWGRQFIQMSLPSFRPSYLFLLQVFMDVIHEALRLRLEQRPNNLPSFLSIRPLLRECKEVLRGAVIVKQYYQTMVDSVISEDEFPNYEEKYAGELDQFDDDMRKMLEIYFTYLQSWLIALQNLPEASLSLKNVLEQEWTFTKQICPHVIGGEAEAGKRFSTLASSLLNSIEYFLETGIDDFTTSLYNWTMQEEEEEEEQSEQGDVDQDYNNNEELEDDNEEQEQQRQREKELRHSFQQTSRNCKKLFNEARERASKALGFAKLLRKDLEIAADFNIAVTTVELLAKLKTTRHVQVIASNDPGYLMFIPERIMGNRQLILQLLNVTCGREDLTVSVEVGHKEEGYLLMVCCEGGKDHVPECPLWFGQQVRVEPTAETAIALSHLQVEGLLLVVIHSSQLMTQRKDFEEAMGRTVELVNEQTSCHQAIAESLTELKAAAMELQERVVQAIKQVDEKFYFEDIAKLEDGERNHLLNLYRETMLKGYNFGFEYLREVTRLVSGESRMKLGKRLVEFARDWMNFVTSKCEKGRGMRPKWASQGFDFLIVACEPKVLACLTDEEYQELKRSINDCISHVVGSADRNTPVSPTHGNIHIPRSSSVDSGRQPYLRYPSWPAEQPGKFSRSSSNISNKSTNSEPAFVPGSVGSDSRYKRHSLESHAKVELHDGEDGGIILDIHRQRNRAGSSDLGNPLGSHLKPSERRKKAVTDIERNREQMLRDGFLIGRVTSHKLEPDYRICARRVNFRWQRGLKIGEGQFGKVYSAVNMDTGELMAMKEMKFRPNDHQALKVIADEIIMFEGIRHTNLVMYYGVEVHRDEMLVFMEFCDRGTLEEAAKMGLLEHNIRIYTREILKAINHLHENNIVHRDIKGANIFLTSSGCLKLGDFGCSVKLKSHATMPGEFNNLVGTMAYMAPEVITNDKEGHGRAADIWSLGCVVIEMTTGKRPWHELENNAQIMFKVGMGGKPAFPELSDEGKDFLSYCFQFDPNLRMTAGELLDHAFVKIDEQDPEVES